MPLRLEDTKVHKKYYNVMKNFEPISDSLEIIGKKIVDAAYTVHKNLGPGLLEKVYILIQR